MRDDGAGERMLGVCINRGCDLEHFIFRTACERDDTEHTRSALGDGTGLVHGESAEFADCFKHRAALDEHAAPRHRGEAGNDGNRRGNHQRAGARDDQQHEPAIKPCEPRGVKK